MRSFVKGVFLSLAFILLFVSCGEDSKKIAQKAEGSEGGPCYGNKTCDDGLTCVSDLCVDLSEVTDKDTGDTSDDGNTGDTGNSGDSGDSGNSGDTGDTGDSGNSGNTGDTVADEDDSDAVELDNEEIPDEVEDDTPTPDIYNCFNDERYFYKNGDCWLKEENLIWSEGVYNTDIFAIRNILREKCANVGGFLPKVTDFRKNITDGEFCENQMPNDKCNDICPVFDDNIKRDDLLYKCRLDKNNTDNQFLYPNTYFIGVMTDIIVGNDYIVSFGYFEQNGNIFNKIQYSTNKAETSPLTCIKNLTEL
jgi:hypothetical protein